MIKVYGMPTCPDCAYVHVQIKDRTGEFEYINIGEDVQYLKEFVRLRDKEAAFDECRENGYLGIPCFVREDGFVTVVPEKVGLVSRPADKTSCSIDGKDVRLLKRVCFYSKDWGAKGGS